MATSLLQLRAYDSLNNLGHQQHMEPYSKEFTGTPTQQSRYTKNELLGQGACKRVYNAFDEEEGLEVAWNEISVAEFAWATESERKKVFAEIELLQRLKHKNILSLYDWWWDKKSSTLNFITELFYDGTLRQYRRKHDHINTPVLKRWAWQILQGLVYLHGHNPPIIHRDLKSDNIFINGTSGQVKIGDLGFATSRAGFSAAMSVIGTPEFMAPELYEEHYSEKVDVYSFGLCLLELATKEYPYAECKNAAQIFKKVTSGIPPQGLQKIADEELKAFVTLCITHDETQRPEARQLLKHPFFDSVRSPTPASKAPSGMLKKEGSPGPSPWASMARTGSVTVAALPGQSAGIQPLMDQAIALATHASDVTAGLTGASSTRAVPMNLLSSLGAYDASAQVRPVVPSPNGAACASASKHHTPEPDAQVGVGDRAATPFASIQRSSTDEGLQSAWWQQASQQQRQQSSPRLPTPQSSSSPLEMGQNNDEEMNEGDVLFDGEASGPSPSGATTPEPGHNSGEEEEEEEEVAASEAADQVSSQGLPMDCRVRLNRCSHDEYTLSFQMSFVTHKGAKNKVGFQYDLLHDTAQDLATEMVDNLSLNPDEAGYIAKLIESEVGKYERNKQQQMESAGGDSGLATDRRNRSSSSDPESKEAESSED